MTRSSMTADSAPTTASKKPCCWADSETVMKYFNYIILLEQDELILVFWQQNFWSFSRIQVSSLPVLNIPVSKWVSGWELSKEFSPSSSPDGISGSSSVI